MTDARLPRRTASPALTAITADHTRRHELSGDACRAGCVTLYLPLCAHSPRAAVPVLLDGADRDQTGRATARSRALQSVLDLDADAQAHLQAAVRDPLSAWLWNTMLVAVAATILSIIASVLAAYAIVRLRYQGRAVGRRRDLPRLSDAAVDPVHSALDRGVSVRAVRHARSR